MKALLIAIAATFVAGCATPSGERVAVYDHKTNSTRYAYKTSGNEFVGTSAEAEKPKPTWYRFGHP